MGRLFMTQLSGRIYICFACHCHLAYMHDIESKNFQSRNGKAYLFNRVVNVSTGISEEKMMTTGPHIVADIYCNFCFQVVGWKYEVAFSKTQKYKEGKFILERAKVIPRLIQGDGPVALPVVDPSANSSDAEEA
ncbi:hypothetical protein AMTRI_Chr08g204970 [Amborella trichopoda]|uniref:Protein yippee-like n=1 Tax=Amborella trichopoda TaxID=13333 RepID=W1PE29_AMBTC|nr:protein yippee-like At3g55890 [Amborella trichopoda]ERN05969.1 hypothetical protein AMTR_s00145p00105880 [Amborella trichopoda]|eukprot:XP_020522825.1 protein yippee-like At3g55890 [Amborella trichopoda]